MSNPKQPNEKGGSSSISRIPGAGRSARPAVIGEELGGDLDFEPDALLDSLLAESPEDAPAGRGAPAVSPEGGAVEDLLEEAAESAPGPVGPPRPGRQLPPIPARPDRGPHQVGPIPGPTRGPLHHGNGAIPSPRLDDTTRPPPPPRRQTSRFPEPDLSPEEIALLEYEDAPSAELFPDSEAPTETGSAPALRVTRPGLAAPGSAPLTAPPSLGAARPSRTPPTWANERPAAAHLAEGNVLDEWLSRAERLQKEAEAQKDPRARARALVVVSELWAMSGRLDLARRAAELALAAAPSTPLVGRQARWLAAVANDFGTVARALDLEARSSPNADTRVHAALLAGEVYRLRLKDGALAQRWRDLAEKTRPADPRAPLDRVAHALAAGHEPPAVPAHNVPELQVLIASAYDAARRRGMAPLPQQEREPTPAIAFQDARRALMAPDPILAARALEMLARVPELERGARMLAAALLAPSPATRPRARSLLESLLTRKASATLLRALCARALEEGDGAGVIAALEHAAASTAFEAADQVTLRALLGARIVPDDPSVLQLTDEEATRPLATAALSSGVPPGAALHTLSGRTAADAQMALGRALSQGELDGVREAFGAYVQLVPEDARARALSLELSLADHDAQLVADRLAGWPAPEEDPQAVRDRLLASALALEISKHEEDARQAFADVLASDPTSEAATRALVAHSPGPVGADLLLGLAQASALDDQRALLLVEAALHRGQDSAGETLSTLREAVHLQPSLPFALSLGEHQARLRGDAASLLEWLRLRREVSTDPIERAHDCTREALLVADTDPSLARTVIQEALDVRPEDAGLRDFYERLVPEPSPDKGRWREQAAEQAASPPAKLALLTEAAVAYELAGDLESATRVANQAAALGGQLAAVLAERTGAHSSHASQLAASWVKRARSAADKGVERELYERLAELDGSRGNQEGHLAWQKAILESNPHDLVALRRLAHAQVGAGRLAEFGPVAATLATLLDRGESTAHAVVAIRHHARNGDWSGGRSLARVAYAHGDPTLWLLRQVSAHARAAGDDQELLDLERQLCERASRAIDASTLALRAAEAAARLGRYDEAHELLDRSVELIPEHLVALTTQAEVLEAKGDFEGAAIALEAIAQSSGVQSHRVGAWHQAGVLWLEKARDSNRGRLALEHAAEIDVTNEDVFTRLQGLYTVAGDTLALADLLQRRLDETQDPAERVALEVTRGRALAEVGDRAAAKTALAAALDANPDHADALAAFADLCLADGDHAGAEQAWIRLARHNTNPAQQAEIYRKLGNLYDTELPNPQRAELAYLEVLKRLPHDVAAVGRLIAVYGRLGNTGKALELQQELVARAGSPTEKLARTVELAELYDTLATSRKEAEQILEQAKKAWPLDATVIRAWAAFYRRHDETRALELLLDRSANDARRALHTGRFDPSLFDVLAAVAELRGGQDAARVARATLACLEGEDHALPGAGPRAGDRGLDELLAPELLSQSLRTLLTRAGSHLDETFSTDLRTLRAARLGPESSDFLQLVAALSSQFGLPEVEIYQTGALGPVCLPAGSAPARLVIGSKLLEIPDDAARFFLLIRGLKILQGKASTLSQTTPIQLWPMLAAFLVSLAPGWNPPAVDAKRLEECRSKLRAFTSADIDPDVPGLALEVAGAIGARASQLGTAVNQWGNRTALLATGDLSAALRAIALSQNNLGGPPPGGVERMKWVTRNPEARDLAVFSVSEQYAEARRRLNLAGDGS